MGSEGKSPEKRTGKSVMVKYNLPGCEVKSVVHAVNYSVHAVEYSVHAVNYSVHAVKHRLQLAMGNLSVSFCGFSGSLFQTFRLALPSRLQGLKGT